MWTKVLNIIIIIINIIVIVIVIIIIVIIIMIIIIIFAVVKLLDFERYLKVLSKQHETLGVAI